MLHLRRRKEKKRYPTPTKSRPNSSSKTKWTKCTRTNQSKSSTSTLGSSRTTSSTWLTVEQCHSCISLESSISCWGTLATSSYSSGTTERPMGLTKLCPCTPWDWWSGAFSCIFFSTCSCTPTKELWFLRTTIPGSITGPKIYHWGSSLLGGSTFTLLGLFVRLFARVYHLFSLQIYD